MSRLGLARRLAAFVLVAGLVLGAAGVAAAALTQQASVRPAFRHDDVLVVLAIGSDVGPPHRPGNPLRGRADAIHLIAVDTAAKRATIVDIPRDSLVGGTKVNAHLQRGGPSALQAQLEGFTGVSIDYWALTTFRSIENMVDGLEGVTVDVPTSIHDRFSGASFSPGPQEVAGHQALAFVRARKTVAGGDFGRTRNQGLLLRSAHAQIRAEQSGLPELARLVGLFSRNTVTNIPPSDLLPLALLATEIDPANVRQDALGGSTGTGAGGASIVRLQPGGAFERIRAGHVGP